MEITAQELAAICAGTVEGRAEARVSDFAKIEEAGEGDLSFVANPKYAHYAASTGASVLLVANDFEAPAGTKATLVRVADPYASLAMLMRMASEAREKPSGIESPVSVAQDVNLPDDIYLGAFSYIASGVVIEPGVLIYPQVYIGPGCHIGAGTILYPGVKIYGGCKIGKNCIIHSGTVIGSDGFGFAPNGSHYEKIPQLGGVIIEDDVEIGANTTIDRATFGDTVIGRGTKLDNLIQIAHNVKIGTDNVFAAQTGVAGSTHIGSRNRVGGQCGFAGHITVGDDNEFGAQSGFHTNVGSRKRMIGYPAVDVMQFARNSVNLKRLAEFLANQKKKDTK